MLIIGSLMQMAFLLLSTTINNWHQENERMKEQYLNLQNEHYQYLEQKNIETRKFRHDMRQHLYAMKEYIRVSKWEELDNYIDLNLVSSADQIGKSEVVMYEIFRK